MALDQTRTDSMPRWFPRHQSDRADEECRSVLIPSQHLDLSHCPLLSLRRLDHGRFREDLTRAPGRDSLVSVPVVDCGTLWCQRNECGVLSGKERDMKGRTVLSVEGGISEEASADAISFSLLQPTKAFRFTHLSWRRKPLRCGITANLAVRITVLREYHRAGFGGQPA